jgi:hypothetical protein
MSNMRQHSIPQGLKPVLIFGLCGTTEVVPCYKTLTNRRWNWFFRSLQSSYPSTHGF